MNITTIEVPLNTSTSANAIGAILTLEGSPGILSLNIQDIVTKGVKYTSGPVGTGGTIRVLESDDSRTWTQVGSNIVLGKGGEKAVSLISRKKFLAISGHNAGGGYVRIDIAHRGEPFRGQVTVGNFGKRGLGKDYIGEAASALLTAEPAVAAWPE